MWTGLRRYLASGWAFLVPYTVLYGIYGFCGWPMQRSASGFSALEAFWVLHGVHGMMIVVALGRYRRLGTRSIIRRACLAWFCVGLLFWLPGAFLEFPADPWAHFSRINEWHERMTVADHSAGLKSAYFFGYSALGLVASGRAELVCLDFFHAVCCSMLAWQYYRLGRATGLGQRAAFVFTLLTTITLGNNIFSFYRYYGISSSVFAHIAFVACTRLFVLKARAWACGSTKGMGIKMGVTVLAAAVVMALNHPQALGFAGLSGAAVAGWAVTTRYGKTGVWGMSIMTFLACVGAWAWIGRGDVGGDWLTFWGGFGLFSPGTTASQRALDILGLVGVVHLVGGGILLRQNHIAGWLAVVPALALSLPCVALPLAKALAPTGNLLMFHRLLLATPVPLALVWLGVKLGAASERKSFFCVRHLPRPLRENALFISILLALALFTTAPAGRPTFNRFFNSFDRSNIGTGWQQVDTQTERIARILPPGQQLIGPPNVLFISDALGLTHLLHTTRNYSGPRRPEMIASDLARVNDFAPRLRLVLPRPTDLTQPTSLAGFLSGHWPPQAIALECVGYQELHIRAKAQGGKAERLGNLEIIRFDQR